MGREGVLKGRRDKIEEVGGAVRTLRGVVGTWLGCVCEGCVCTREGTSGRDKENGGKAIQRDKLSLFDPCPKGVFTPHIKHPLGVTAPGPRALCPPSSTHVPCPRGLVPTAWSPRTRES